MHTRRGRRNSGRRLRPHYTGRDRHALVYTRTSVLASVYARVQICTGDPPRTSVFRTRTARSSPVLVRLPSVLCRLGLGLRRRCSLRSPCRGHTHEDRRCEASIDFRVHESGVFGHLRQQALSQKQVRLKVVVFLPDVLQRKVRVSPLQCHLSWFFRVHDGSSRSAGAGCRFPLHRRKGLHPPERTRNVF